MENGLQQVAGLAQSVERETLSRHGISRLRVRPPRSASLFLFCFFLKHFLGGKES